MTSPDAFLDEADRAFLAPVQLPASLHFARSLKVQLRDRLWDDDSCMLPSFNCVLPTGNERGRYVSVDVGGTTLRIALVELAGRETGDGEADGGVARVQENARDGRKPEMSILMLANWRIDAKVRSLEGMEFFVWLAERMVEAVDAQIADGQPWDKATGVPVAVAWSFPICQTSPRTGLIQPMGKGFKASDGMVDRDLAAVIRTACAYKGLGTRLESLMNDAGAALFAHAYTRPDATRMGLVVGTGVNLSCYLPASAVGPAKFGERGRARTPAAGRVVVNTELSLFGGDGVMPLTRWDEQLRRAHPKPDFQPFEYLTSGHYLGEICRLALVDAIASAGVLGGIVPKGLSEPYGLGSDMLSLFEQDTTESLEIVRPVFVASFPCSPEPADLAFVRRLARLVTRRSSCLVAGAIFALWELRGECEAALAAEDRGPAGARVDETDPGRIVVAYNGAVIQSYPNYRRDCQQHLDELAGARHVVELMPAGESSLLGTAVAAACEGASDTAAELGG